MNAPTESGYYWAKYEQTWGVVYYSKPNKHVLKVGQEIEFDTHEFAEWGERVERKGAGR
jgi:hypothetical protein